MNEPFLILHKVRGLPAFDIAEQMEVGDEVWWIIPTSGHRAYPYWNMEIRKINWQNKTVWSSDLSGGNEIPLPMPSDCFDHYAANERRSSPASAASDLLSLIGLGKAKPSAPIKRRSIP